MRFLKQRTLYTCVPVAIINANKFFGGKATGKDIKVIKNIMNWGFNEPTDLKKIEKAVATFGKDLYRYTRLIYPNYRTIIKHLKTGNPIIFSFHLIDVGLNEYGHMTIMYMEDDKIVCVNENTKETLTTISKFNLRFVKLKKTRFYPEVYLLESK